MDGFELVRSDSSAVETRLSRCVSVQFTNSCIRSGRERMRGAGQGRQGKRKGKEKERKRKEEERKRFREKVRVESVKGRTRSQCAARHATPRLNERSIATIATAKQK